MMKFFDVNCMLGHWYEKKLIFDNLPGLREQMGRYSIQSALVYGSFAFHGDPREGNRMLAKTLRAEDDLYPVFSLTPLIGLEFGGTEPLGAFVKASRCAAIRLFPKEHSFTLYPFNVHSIMEFAVDNGLPVMVDYDQIARQYDALYQLLHTYPEVKFIFVQPFYRDSRVIYSLLDQFSNLYIDTSALIGYRAIEDYVRVFGTGRLLFGTKMPFLEPGVMVGRILYADISQKDKENIAYNNAYSLFGIGRICGEA